MTQPTKTIASNEAISIAEKRLLNAVFNKPDLLDQPELNKDLFLHGNCRSIFAAFERLRSTGSTFTKDALLQEAADRDINVTSELIEFITSSDKVSDWNEIKDAVQSLREGSKRLVSINKLNEAIKKIDEQPLTESIDTAKDLIDEASSTLIKTEDVKRVYDMQSLFEKYDEETSRRRTGKQYPFRNFIFDSLIIDGAAPGTIGLLTGASGMGKSSCGLSLLNSLIEFDLPVMMFSLEMALIPTLDRLISKRTGIAYSEIVYPKDEDEYDANLIRIEQEKAELLKKKNFRICEDASLSIEDIKKHIKKFQSEINQNYCIVIIDLLSMVKDFTRSQGGANFSQVAEIAINELSAVVKELGVHVLGIVQLNRSNETEKANSRADLSKFRPTRAQIKNANAYIERARYAIGAYRERFWAEQFLDETEFSEMEDIMEIIVLKQNNGPCKSMKALYLGEVFDILPIENELSDVD